MIARHKIILKWLALGLGLAAFGAAVGYSVAHIDRHQLAQARLWPVVGLVGVMLGQLFFTGAMFWVVTLSFDAKPRVTLWRMVEVICASSLLNYAPAGAGVAGRVAYLRYHHSLPFKQIVVSGAAVGAVYVVTTGGVLVLAFWVPMPWSLVLGAVGLILLTLATGPVARWFLWRPIVLPGLWVPLRVADMAATTARLWLAFQAINHPITVGSALVLGTVDTLASMVKVTPNGLGLSELLIAKVSGLGSFGSLAKVMDRAVNILVLLPTGLWAMRHLRHLAMPATVMLVEPAQTQPKPGQ